MPVHHVILLKFKPDVTPADVDKVSASLHALPSQIPAITRILSGKKIKHRLDRDFDECVILVIKDEDALKNGYLPHPAHREYQELSAPYIQEKLIFDVDVQE